VLVQVMKSITEPSFGSWDFEARRAEVTASN